MNPDMVNWGCSIYEEWSARRVGKLVQVLGADWFPGKRVLDVGTGHGMNGKNIAALGANVVFTDARPTYVETLKKDGFEAYVMDNEKEWTVDGPFDLIIHWGLLYHVDHWRQDIRCAMERTPLLCLETCIATGTDPHEELKIHEKLTSLDHAVSGVGTIMSAVCMENYLTEQNLSYTRYDDADLNVARHHCYNWNENGTAGHTEGSVYHGGCGKLIERGQRRFWIIKRG